MLNRPRFWFIALFVGQLLTLPGCGNSGDDSSSVSNNAVPSATRVQLESDGDGPVGNFPSFDHTRATALIGVTQLTKGQFTRVGIGISVEEAQSWMAYFWLPAELNRITPGRYQVGTAFPDDGMAAQADVYRTVTHGLTRKCIRQAPGVTFEEYLSRATMARSAGLLGSLSGWFSIDGVVYEGDKLASLTLRFELWCNKDAVGTSIRGTLQYRADDATTVAGPDPVPAGLWLPTEVPIQGNYIRLESDPGDPVGQGQAVTVQSTEDYPLLVEGRSLLSIGELYFWGANSLGGWSGKFRGRGSLDDRMRPGFFGDLRAGQTHYSDSSFGPLLRVSGPGGYCPTDNYVADLPIRGWFAIDAISFGEDGELKSLDLRFEQRCEGASGALRGKTHWTAP